MNEIQQKRYERYVIRTLTKGLHADYDVPKWAKVNICEGETWRNGMVSISHTGSITAPQFVLYPITRTKKGVTEDIGMLFAEVLVEDGDLILFYEVMTNASYDFVRLGSKIDPRDLAFKRVA